jgi:radical SAM superfamily enzyme YgiQ (UPF0313 family)
MNIILAKPKTEESVKGIGTPLGLTYIAAVLREAGHKVRILDFMVEEKDPEYSLLSKTIRSFKPMVVGITCNTSERFEVFKMAKIVKNEDPNIKVVVGGPHITFTAKETMERIPEIDASVLFEGEYTLREVCEKYGNNNYDLSDVKGVVFRKDGKLVSTGRRPFIENLDELPFPARDLLKMEKYDLHLPLPDRPWVTNMVANRGCPFGCKFCAATHLGGLKIRSRSAENVVDEVELVMEAYPFLKGIYFYDDHFTLNRKTAMGICEGIKARGIDMQWGCYGRVDSIDRELVREMKSAGCRMISFGVESGSLRMLRRMGKKTTPEMIKRAIATAKAEGLITKASFIFGYPSESLIDIIRTFRLIKEAKLEPYELARSYYLLLFPGTEIYEEVRHTLPDGFNWVDEFDLPNYLGIPKYMPPNDKLRMGLIYALRGSNVAKKKWRDYLGRILAYPSQEQNENDTAQ